MKRLFSLLAFLLILIVGLVAMLPVLLSTPIVTSSILSIVNGCIAGSVAVQKMEVSWTRGIDIRGITVSDADGKQVLAVDAIKWPVPLITLLYNEKHLGMFEVDDAKVSFNKDKDGESYNLERIFKSEKKATSLTETLDIVAMLTGPTLTIHATFWPKTISSGEAVCIMTSPLLQTKIEGTLHDGTLTLRNDVVGTYTPIDKPVSFAIKKEGVLVPVSPFSLKGIKVPSITINAAKQKAQYKGSMSLVFSLIKFNPSKGKEIEFWFTPIYASIEAGIATIKRFDFLCDKRFPLAVWGTVDLDKELLDMTLGISGKALERALFLFTVGQEKFIQVPIHGTIEHPIFDTHRATAQITALRLQETWSPQTIILGTLIKAVSSVGSDDPPVPPPTTQPFPWN